MFFRQPKLTKAFKLALLAIIVALTICSCNNRNDVVFESFRSINESLSNDANFLSEQNQLLSHKLENNSKDPVTALQTEMYLPNISRVKRQAGEMNNYLESIKNDLISRFGEFKSFAVPKLSDEQLSNYAGKYVTKKLADEINQRMKNFRDSIFRFDSVDNVIVNHDMAKFKLHDSTVNTYSEIDLKNFEDLPLVAVFAMINNCKVITSRIEYSLLTRFYSLTSYRGDSFDRKVYPLAFLNSSVIKLGNTIEVTAAIGALSVGGKPEFIINNKKVELGVDGAATAIIKPKQTGVSSIVVRIAYTDITGEKKSFVRKLKYEVIGD